MKANYFQILFRDGSEPKALVIAAAAKAGTGYGESGSSDEAAVLAQPGNFTGWLDRDVTATGPTLAQLEQVEAINYPGQTDKKVGTAVRLETGAIELELEDGTTTPQAILDLASITTAITAGTPVVHEDGLLRIAAAAESYLYVVVQKMAVVEDGDVRIRIRRQPGTVPA